MKKIALTLGDPAGIGAEVLVKALSSPHVRGCLPVMIGDLPVVRDALSLCKSSLDLKIIKSPDEASLSPGTLWLLDVNVLTSYKKTVPDAQNGKACVEYIRKAVKLAAEKKVDGIVTAPISKEALKLAGFRWPGHTEMLAEFTGTKEYAMMLAGGPLRVILVTIHTALRDVPGLITRERVLRTIRLAQKACDMLGIDSPAIAVAGLNPHAGESGIFGEEEAEAIIPAIEAAKNEGITVDGPYPPDTLFHKAYHGAIDIIVTMYHDQGLIPLKMIAFDTGVNVTVGLPIIRTSPDHGTAYDIAWKGIAVPASMIEAINMAIRLKM
ncbi:MAG TPA: 4-hydroxythreonine-4-phosphate dehydrogenase PdxA [Thermodesulfovibrionales bacterium]|nr:4-hydroxythreonine-4-phosphate dehydrogenase PdxA [Thermodesulfovibrionales bacterium]